MNYETVELKEQIIVGLSDKTSNQDPNMGTIITSLWEKLYNNNVYETIKNKVNDYGIGLYSGYTGSEYNITVGASVSKNENPELSYKIIPSGKYAKFSIVGDMIKDVANAWGEIWNMELDRTFTGDYEEYLDTNMDGNAKINIYVAIK